MIRSKIQRPCAFAIATLLAVIVAAGPVGAATADAMSEPEAVESGIDWFEIGATALDVVVLRPTGVLSTIGGFAFFAASAPLVAPSGHLETTWDIFVFNTYDYTFVRRIGEL